MIRVRFVYILLFVSITLSGCLAEFSTELVEENSYTVGEHEIRELIYREDGFPDAVYERVYEVKSVCVEPCRNGRFQQIGSYRDESGAGITVLPEMVGDWLVIYSSSHLFLWQPDEDVRHFDPYQAEGWLEYADQFQFGLNGHYDYQATGFWVENGRLFIEYDALYSRDGYPSTLLFTSDDEGVSYVTVDKWNAP